MSSTELGMTLEDSAVFRKKRQMSSGGSVGGAGGTSPHCGLSSLLACRGRAAAFARDLHSRLRTLGAEENPPQHYYNNYECESPSSPIDGSGLASKRSDDQDDPPFYDVDSDSETENPFRCEKLKNGFRFDRPFDESPVKQQPVPHENGHSLYSPICFEDCARKVCYDAVDSPSKSALPPSDFVSSWPDSDSDFESAKSDPSDGVSDDIIINNVNETTPNLSLSENNRQQITQSGKTDINSESDKKAQTEHNPDSFVRDYDKSEEEEDHEIAAKSSVELCDDIADVQDDIEDDRPQRVRRCSSLKTGKTPPGTPGRKKIVRFADVLGLDLADVKTFMDEIPVIPKSAYDDLTDCDLQNSPPVRMQIRLGALTLVPLFQLAQDMTEKLEKQNVCLESARVCEGVHVTVCGSVRVRNLDFHKTVHIRYSMNNWKSFTDLQAVYVQGSCDGYSDRFQFILYAPCINSGQRLEFAVRFQCKGQQFWDNNRGVNYCFDCLALGAAMPDFNNLGPLHPTIDWHPSFY